MALPLELGTVVQNYRLDSVLGQGGMGCVYAATDRTLGRVMALKVLAPELAASEDYVSRFLEEARIVNNVRHPNIVDIPVFIKEDGLVAYAMEYVEGAPLSKVIAQGPLTVRQAVNITFQLVSALEAVHAHGVVHRDLKPDNIIITGTREGDFSQVPCLKILDFGIAKSTSEDVGHKTVTGSMLGTPSYMAPEQVAASPVSSATDLYAVAEMLYEMVAGQRVFSAPTPMEILRMKLAETPPELSWPDVPGWQRLDQLVQAGLQPHPQDRLTLAQLVMGLNDVLVEQPDAPLMTPHSFAYPAPSARTPAPALRTPSFVPPPPSAPLDAHNTPVNMQSVVALPAPRPAWSRLAAPVGVVMVLAAAAVAGFAYLGQRTPDSFVEAAPVAVESAVEARAEPPTPTPVVVAPAASAEAPPAAVAPEPPEPSASNPVAAPAPEPKKQTKRASKTRRRRARRAKAKPKPAPAEEPSVVKKSDLVEW